jgi:NodT family efflux transporter outer membrane factor (OMF) lipoprotein
MKSSLSLALAAALLAGCTVGPDYQQPPTEVPAKFKELEGWKQSEPQDAASRGAWWKVFADPVLDDLEAQVDVSNQSLKVSEAAYRQAAAVVSATAASLFPTVTADGVGERARTGPHLVGNSFSAALGASWEPDVWGRIHRAVENAASSAQASAGDLASARLSAQSTLAMDYFELRSADELKRLLDATVAAYERSLTITKNQYAQGVAARADVVQADTQLKTTQAQAIAVGVQRAQLEHAIATLIGKPPAEFTLTPAQGLAPAPEVPVGLPSTLLERRPDIAAAERRMQAANAEIGVAIAAYYPDLTLSGSTGFAASTLNKLLSSNVWALGPATLAGTLFDGGLRSAQVDEARAAYEGSIATYRQTVLTAFQQVEDDLAALRILAEQARVQAQAVAAAEEAVGLVLNQYRAGTVPYTSVITAQATALANEQTALSIRQSRLTYTTALVVALGGDWGRGQLPQN